MRPPLPSTELDSNSSSTLAYEALLPEILAVPEEQLAGATLDVTAAIRAVARLSSTLRDLGPTLESAWHGFDSGQLDRLELCTLALHHAESRLRRAPDDLLRVLIRHQAATLFLSSYDDLQHAVQQLLDGPTLPALRGPAPQTAPEPVDEPARDEEPAPVTLVSLCAPSGSGASPSRAVA